MSLNSKADTTSVKPWQLNYDRYSLEKYDRDIVNSIPYHKEIHHRIAEFLANTFKPDGQYLVLDLGVGTGITSKVVQDVLPKSKLEVVDFSKHMLQSAKKKLGTKNVKYVFGDYSKMRFKGQYDITICVIGLHHQNSERKKRLFRKVHFLLKPGGVFILADLVTYRDKQRAALNQALHFHHLVEHTTDQKTLAEWAYHHIFLNDLAPIEDQVQWLEKCGFKLKIDFLEMNTVLIFARK